MFLHSTKINNGDNILTLVLHFLLKFKIFLKKFTPIFILNKKEKNYGTCRGKKFRSINR